MKVALILHDLGSYHYARLKAASNIKSCVVRGVEVYASAEFAEFRTSCEPGSINCISLGVQRGSSLMTMKTAIHACLEEMKPDVVCVPGWSFSISHIALAWCCSRGARIVVMSESNSHDHYRIYWKEAVKRGFVSICHAGLVGGASHKAYLQQLGLPLDRVFTGYDAVDNEHFSRKAAEARQNTVSARVQYGLPHRYILASCRLIERKNVHGLIRAYRGCCDKREDFPDLVILGDGLERKKLEELVSCLSLSRKVHFAGFQSYSDTPSYYALALGFVHAATSEQWGLVVNEALACGIPVAVSAQCGASELILDKRNGVRFDASSQTSIQYALDWLADLTPEERKLAANVGEAMVDTVSPEQFTIGLESAVLRANEPRQLTGFETILSKLIRQFLLSRYGA